MEAHSGMAFKKNGHRPVSTAALGMDDAHSESRAAPVRTIQQVFLFSISIKNEFISSPNTTAFIIYK